MPPGWKAVRREGVEDDGSAVTIELVKIKEQVDEEGARIDDDSAVEEIAHKLKQQYKTVLESFREVIYIIRMVFEAERCTKKLWKSSSDGAQIRETPVIFCVFSFISTSPRSSSTASLASSSRRRTSSSTSCTGRTSSRLTTQTTTPTDCVTTLQLRV